MDHHTRKLTGLTDPNLHFDENWLSEDQKNGEKITIIQGVLTYMPSHCIKCGCKNEGQIIKNGTYQTVSKIMPMYTQKTVLKLKRARFLCKSCGQTFNAQTTLIAQNCQISKQLKLKIALDLKKNISRKEIAKENHVSDITIQRVMATCVSTFTPNFRYLPKVLCVDEFRSCEGKMSFIFMDGKTRKIIEILENRQLAFLTAHFLRYDKAARENVRYLVMDMNAPYAQLIKTIFPNAQIVIDRFHIVQQITRSFNQLRVKVMNQLRKEDDRKARRLKSFWRLLLKDSLELNSSDYHYNRSFRRLMSEKAIIDELLSYSEELKLAYDTTQQLRYHLQQKDHLRFFDQVDTLDPRLPKWFRKKLTFFNRYKTGIINALALSYSNGIVEGTNNKIKVIKRVAYGYRNFLNFRARIYLIQGLVFQQLDSDGKQAA